MDIVAQYLVNAVMLGVIYSLVAVGFSLYFGILDVIQFSHAEIVMVGVFSGMAVINLLPAAGITNSFLLLVAAFAGAIIFTSLVCILFGRVTVRPLRDAPPVTTLVATLAAGMVIRYIVMIFYPGAAGPQRFAALLPSSRFTSGMLVVGADAGIVLLLGILLIVGIKLFLDKTRNGMAMRAVAQDRETASLMGVDVNKVTDVTFLIGGILAACAGVLYGLYYNVVIYNIGDFYGPVGWASAIIGGLGNLYGAVAGGFLLGFLITFAAAYIPGGAAFKFPIGFIILLVFLVTRPSGILKRRERR